MRNKILSILRFLAAMVVGYAIIAVGTTLTFGVILDGFSYHQASLTDLLVASLGALISGLCGGYAAAWIGGRQPVLHACAVLILLTLDTTYVTTSGISTDPLWFDLVAGGGLMAATVVAGFLRRYRMQNQGLVIAGASDS